MYLEYNSDGHFEAATGTLQLSNTEGIIEYQSCMWVEDTRDGGASDWLPRMSTHPLKRWIQEANTSNEIPPFHYRNPADTPEPAKKPIHAHCYCAGVQFWIQPPTPSSRTARSLFPDLLVPYSLGPAASVNPSDTPWWLRDDATRFLAGTCACASCRRASGFGITFWAFIPTVNIYLDADLTCPFPTYGPGHENDYWGTMKKYTSSEGVTRTFCGKCGANVFWDGGEGKGREGLLDVAVGLLDAESGARAEELLEWWTERVSFREMAVDRGLVWALEKGLREWEVRRRGCG